MNLSKQFYAKFCRQYGRNPFKEEEKNCCISIDSVKHIQPQQSLNEQYQTNYFPKYTSYNRQTYQQLRQHFDRIAYKELLLRDYIHDRVLEIQSANCQIDVDCLQLWGSIDYDEISVSLPRMFNSIRQLNLYVHEDNIDQLAYIIEHVKCEEIIIESCFTNGPLLQLTQRLVQTGFTGRLEFHFSRSWEPSENIHIAHIYNYIIQNKVKVVFLSYTLIRQFYDSVNENISVIDGWEARIPKDQVYIQTEELNDNSEFYEIVTIELALLEVSKFSHPFEGVKCHELRIHSFTNDHKALHWDLQSSFESVNTLSLQMKYLDLIHRRILIFDICPNKISLDCVDQSIGQYLQYTIPFSIQKLQLRISPNIDDMDMYSQAIIRLFNESKNTLTKITIRDRNNQQIFHSGLHHNKSLSDYFVNLGMCDRKDEIRYMNKRKHLELDRIAKEKDMSLQ